ncbi:MAG: hypothetical protein DRQ55_01005 [Planctomycetota bacterium]|nr:MAG: hypothetical protein DRQ55_01005 [Planctomycetota bacterium]
MRVSLVFPPNRAVPASPYASLPLLAGGLIRAGHEVAMVDVNLEVFEGLVTPAVLESAVADFNHAWDHLRALPSPTPDEVRRLQALAKLGIIPLDQLDEGQRAADILRDPARFYQPELATWAYDRLANLLRVLYSTNPVFYGLRSHEIDGFFDYLEGPIDNPINRVVESVCIDKILASEPDLVALTIPFNEQTAEAFAILKALKARAPDLKTMVGGQIVTWNEQALCTDPRFYAYADFAMVSEADESFPVFVDALEQGAELAGLPNLYCRGADGTIHPPGPSPLPNLDKIAAPDFAAVPVERYYLPEIVVNLQTSRGCYYGKCTFCSDSIKKNFRMRSPRLVTQDLEQIQAQTGARHTILWDPLTPPRLMRAIAEWNCERPEQQRVFWGAETKFEKLFCDPEFTDLIHAGGARFLQFGYESGSQRVIDLMVKGNDLERVHDMLDTLRDSQIAVSVQWFIGFPRATEQEDLLSFRYLDFHRDAVLLSSYMGMFSISPDDDIYRDGGEQYGIELFQHDCGRWDYRHRDGSDHYDRSELHAAYLSRGDAENMDRVGFFLYLTHHPERVRQTTFFERGGALPMTWSELADARPSFPRHNSLASFDFDIFTDPDAQAGSPAGGQLPAQPSHAVYNGPSKMIWPLSERERRLLSLADGERSATELVQAMQADADELRQELLRLVRRGVLVIPHQLRAGVVEPPISLVSE